MFDGDNPHLWIKHCETYFDMYSVEPEAWVKIATMHLTPSVACWFQSLERQYHHISWPLFCTLLHGRYGRDQHQSLLRQLFCIRQTGLVSEYIENFSTLVDQLSAYQNTADPLYFTTRFVEGLRPDLRAVVLLQRLGDLDTACCLALLQEEVTDPGHRREFQKRDPGFWSKPGYRGPSMAVLSHSGTTSQEPQGLSKPSNTHVPSTDDKFKALRAYRRAKGLCDRCAEKWSKGHTCATSVQLHAMQEVLELFQVADSDDQEIAVDVLGNEQIFLALSPAPLSGQSAKRALQFMGTMHQYPLHILVDSGSTHSFLSQHMVDKIGSLQLVPTNVQVKVADGNVLQCMAVLPQAKWTIQQCTCIQDLKVLSLPSYDLILGMDWLEQFNPMRVDWKAKWLLIQFHGTPVLLQGCGQGMPDDLFLHVAVVKQPQDTVVHPAVATLLDTYSQLFTVPDSLPPVRQCDHSIPLVAGARPVCVRPYRYPPALKDEIEAQVGDMLKKGIIQPSSSSFSSPVLLVRKKDGSFRFCVDYRYLNALTVKTRFPIPIFEHLIDELAGASWFSTLDLLSGYHQVRLKAGEEYKTAFQTHHGQFEFLVMAFGLSGAPATFQGAMNTTLRPLLRKCVIVFFDDILVFSSTFEEHLTHLEQVFALLKKRLMVCQTFQMHLCCSIYIILGACH
jgi:hypothetical protein